MMSQSQSVSCISPHAVHSPLLQVHQPLDQDAEFPRSPVVYYRTAIKGAVSSAP